jgi:hypothetical protein
MPERPVTLYLFLFLACWTSVHSFPPLLAAPCFSPQRSHSLAYNFRTNSRQRFSFTKVTALLKQQWQLQGVVLCQGLGYVLGCTH